MFHPHEHSNLLNGFLSFYVHFEPTKISVLKSCLLRPQQEVVSKLKKAMKNNQLFERSFSYSAVSRNIREKAL